MAFIPAAYKNIYEAWAKEVFRLGANVTEAIGRGFRSVQTEMLEPMKKMGVFNLPKDAAILLLNDFDLTLTKMLRDLGYYNIYLLVLDTSETKAYSKYMFKVKYQDKNFKKMFPDGLVFWKQILTVEMKEVHDVGVRGLKKSTHTEYFIKGVEQLEINEFDLVIANPPYGRVGADLTDAVRKYVKFKQYVNLLPANDYKRVTGLHQYVRNMEPINNGFEDAAVTTHLCEVVKEANDMTVEEFEISQYIDPQLDKYFRILRDRQDYELIYTTNTPIDKIKTLDISKTVILGAKDVNHRHLPYSKNCVQYKWNVEESVDAAWVEANYACKSSGKTGQTSLFVIYLDSAEEKQALVNLLYGTTGFKFIQKLWTAINVDSYCMPNKYLPKVKLYTGITWEEILADYGYTETEIAEVIVDLDRFKDMERD
jgi:hypothetical protein